MKNDRIGRCELPWIMLAIPQKIHFAESFRASVEPGIEPPMMRLLRAERWWHHQAERLHAFVDFRDVTAHYQARSSRPRVTPRRKFVRTRLALSQQNLGVLNLIGLAEFAVRQRVSHGLLENHHVG